MKVIVFEDNDQKFDVVQQALVDEGLTSKSVVRAKSLFEFAHYMPIAFDLCIIDIFMPMTNGAESQFAGPEILSLIEKNSGLSVPIVAITEYAKELKDSEDIFLRKGCLVLDYSKPDLWRPALKIFVDRARDRHRYKWIAITAIRVERDAFAHLDGVSLQPVQRSGLEFDEFEIDGHLGAIVSLPRAGLVTASIVTTRVLENYSPQILCMSGICAGIGKETYLGQLLVTELCWEYQAGKWTEDTLEGEIYQVEVAENIKVELRGLLSDKSFFKALDSGFSHGDRPPRYRDPKFGIFATGSAVVASDGVVAQIKKQHRKASGIDMELYGFHRAVSLLPRPIPCFSAKTVVDKANTSKGDELHNYGSYLSAGFCREALKRMLA